MQLIQGTEIYNIVTNTLNMVDPRLVNHGKRVAYIVYKMLQHQGGHSMQSMVELFSLAILHDLGAYKTEEIDHMLEFETQDVLNHSIYGYLFLKNFSPLGPKAEAVLFHHLDFDKINQAGITDTQAAQMIKVADRVDILLLIHQNRFDPQFLARQSGVKFDPAIYRLFCETNQAEHLVEKILDGRYLAELDKFISSVELTPDFTNSLLCMLAFAIDFRSEFTVIHTITTVSISHELAVLAGCGAQELQMIYYGAFLHDLGKIAIPIEILEKPGSLTYEEMERMKTHVNLTAEILGEQIDPAVRNIALRHHEKLDGSGYPLGLTARELTDLEQIVAVSDIISALRSRRSYKEPFPKEKILAILRDMSQKGQLSPRMISLALENYDLIMENTDVNCSHILKTYENMKCEHQILHEKFQHLFGAAKSPIAC